MTGRWNVVTPRTAASVCSACKTPVPWQRLSARPRSDVRFGATSDELGEIINRNLAPGQKGSDKDAGAVLTTRREALSLYREILRQTRLFVWRDTQGHTWRDTLRASARQEFEAARSERDPQVVTRLLVMGRDCLHQTAEKFLAQRQRIIDEEARQPPPFGVQ